MQEKIQTLPQTKNAAILQTQLSQIMLTTAIKQLYLMDICLEMLPFFVALENSETDANGSYYSNLYHYAGNNPVKYTDPDGREIDISDNSTENQAKILSDIQSLTDSKLRIQDGKIVVESTGSGTKESGTALIDYLCSSNNTVKISIGRKGQNYASRPSGGGENGDACNCSITYDGESLALPTVDILSGVSLKITGAEIILGHELIHAYHNFTGTNKGKLLVSVGIYGTKNDTHLIMLTDGNLWMTNGKLEEYVTVFGPGISENSLRVENGYGPRAAY